VLLSREVWSLGKHQSSRIDTLGESAVKQQRGHNIQLVPSITRAGRRPATGWFRPEADESEPESVSRLADRDRRHDRWGERRSVRAVVLRKYSIRDELTALRDLRRAVS
jgi:hypothetical protein